MYVLLYFLQVSSSRLRQDQERARPFYGKDAWTGVHRRRSADAAAGEVSPMTSRYSPVASAGEERKKKQGGNTKMSYEKVAWTWSDRRRNFSTGLGAASPVAASPLLRDETRSRSYSKNSWEKRSTRAAKPLAQVCRSFMYLLDVFLGHFRGRFFFLSATGGRVERYALLTVCVCSSSPLHGTGCFSCVVLLQGLSSHHSTLSCPLSYPARETFQPLVEVGMRPLFVRE